MQFHPCKYLAVLKSISGSFPRLEGGCTVNDTSCKFQHAQDGGVASRRSLSIRKYRRHSSLNVSYLPILNICKGVDVLTSFTQTQGRVPAAFPQLDDIVQVNIPSN